MAIDLYLAMTAAEFFGATVLPEKMAWMACHFSAYGTSLSNIPRELPAGSLLILNDRTPVHGHDANAIADTLGQVVEELSCSGILLDFQRPGCQEAAKIAQTVTALPCPVCVSQTYAGELNCPVFLPPVPPHIPVAEYLSPWSGREIWLEAALDGLQLHISEKGCNVLPFSAGREEAFPHYDETLFCHYRISKSVDALDFFLRRTRADLDGLLSAAAGFGVTMSVGLWQELQTFPNG